MILHIFVPNFDVQVPPLSAVSTIITMDKSSTNYGATERLRILLQCHGKSVDVPAAILGDVPI
jgi:hypothetical protein